jgi:hypothetical protein
MGIITEVAFSRVEGGVEASVFCPLYNKNSTMFLPITPLRLTQIVQRTESIQVAAPELNADQREFLINGIVPEEDE